MVACRNWEPDNPQHSGTRENQLFFAAAAVFAFVVAGAFPIAGSSTQNSILALADRAERFEAHGVWACAAACREILQINPSSVSALTRKYCRKALRISAVEFGTNLSLGIA